MNKNKTSIRVEDFSKRIKVQYKNSSVARAYDKYKCTECGVETFSRRDTAKGEKYCPCQNIFAGNERLYWIWYAMIQRCDNPKVKLYKDYGGRGIKVEEMRWYDFKHFKKWATASGYKDTLTIERKDVNKNYCPTNCCWITKYEQCFNKRNTRVSKEDVLDMRLMSKQGISRKDIYSKYKDKVNDRTRIDTLVRGDAWRH